MWTPHQAPDGRTYWFNAVYGYSLWYRPDDQDQAPAAVAVDAAAGVAPATMAAIDHHHHLPVTTTSTVNPPSSLPPVLPSNATTDPAQALKEKLAALEAQVKASKPAGGNRRFVKKAGAAGAAGGGGGSEGEKGGSAYLDMVKQLKAKESEDGGGGKWLVR